MKNDKIISNYSVALFKSIASKNDNSKVLDELELFWELLCCNTELYNALVLPIVKQTIKIQIINDINKKLKLSKYSLRFLLLLTKHSRINYLKEIINYYTIILAHNNKVKILKIISAKNFNKNDRVKLEKLLNNEFEKITINYSVDPTIIGGFIVKYDSNQIDYSIKGALGTLLK